MKKKGGKLRGRTRRGESGIKRLKREGMTGRSPRRRGQ
jgi:hypothetical protein